MAIDTSTPWQRHLLSLITFVIVILVIGCLYWARSVLIPVALSILLTFILAPVVSRLQQMGLGRAPAVLVVVTLVGLLVLSVAYLTTSQIAGLARDLPSYQDNITAKVHDLNGGWAEFTGDLEKFIVSLNDPSAAETDPQPVRIVSENPVTGYAALLGMLDPVLGQLGALGLVVVLVIFMLINREDLRNRVIAMAGRNRMAMTTMALDEAGQRISRYLLMQLIINGTYGIGVAIGLLVLGMPYAWLWGLLAAVLRYIPYIGPWVAASMPILLGLAIFEGWARLLALIAFFVVLELISNMVMEPLLYGQSIGVSEASLLVAVAFWTWLWGGIGLVLSVPLTVCLVVLGKYVPALKIFDLLLGDPPEISPGLALYQRLLAKDQEEAAAIVQNQLQSSTPARICDEVLVPCLMSARRDEQSDDLPEEDWREVLDGIRDLIVDVGAEGDRCQLDGTLDSRDLILGFPVRDESEEIVLHMLPPLLDSSAARMTMAGSDLPLSELVQQVEEYHPAVVCLMSLPPGGLSAACLMCRRLRSRFPELGIVVTRWGHPARPSLHEAGANVVAATLQETVDGIQRLLQAGKDEPSTTPQSVARS